MLAPAGFTRHKLDQCLTYDQFVALGVPDGHHHAWHDRYEQLELDQTQRATVAAFSRPMKVLCLTGTWCGDCALQGAALQRIAEAAPRGLIEIGFALRNEEHADLVIPNAVNGGFRVPLTWICAEDYEPLTRFGDRTLSRYRSMARQALGEDYVQAPAPEDPVREVLREVLDEFERAQLILLTSPRWRAHYGD